MKWVGLFLGALLLLSERGMAQTNTSSQETGKTDTIYIPTDLPLPPSAEKVAPTHPFFAAPSTGYEANDEFEELKDRVDKLEKHLASQVDEKNIKVQPGGTLIIESEGDIEIITPGVVKFKAKGVEIPK
jgi:hypothetical protein